MPTTAKKSLREYLQENLSWRDFEDLPDHLHESARMVYNLLDDPSKGQIAHLIVLEKLLRKWNPEFNQQYLITEFGFGVKQEDPATTPSHS